MGAINNAFNQALGTAAAAGLAIKHAKESEELKMNSADSSALIARNQARAAEAEANEAIQEAKKPGGLYEQSAMAEVNAKKAEHAYDRAVKRKNGSIRTRIEKFTELDAANKAVDELNNKYQALKNIKNRAEEQRIYASKATQMALDAKEKFKKHWGGK